MIYTLTFNPALDYIVGMERFVPGIVNRAEKEEIVPGGKGINVSLVLGNLGVENRALGFKSGFTGEVLENMLNAMGCKCDFIALKSGFTRINVKINGDTQTEINAQGPAVLPDELEKLFARLDTLRDGDTLVLAGSVPKSLPVDIYEQILQRLSQKKIRTAVDAEKNLLLNVLKFSPFLIKPNHHELGALFDTELKNEEELLFYAKKLQSMGARHVLVSMAGDGALFLSEDGEVYRQAPPAGKLVYAVGAGDSTVAGFIAGLEFFGDVEKAFRFAVAAGSATAYSPNLARKEEVFALYDKM